MFSFFPALFLNWDKAKCRTLQCSIAALRSKTCESELRRSLRQRGADRLVLGKDPMNYNAMRRGAAVLTLAATALALAACSKTTEAPAAGKPQVSVVTLAPRPVVLTTELPGRTSAYRVAEVRPQVNGIVKKRLFTEGGEVKADQQLYQIDPALYQASFDSQQAALVRARAQLRTANLLVQRYKPLTETRAVSRQTYDDAVAARDQAAADVQSAKAAVDTARINLVYTKVLSPIEGIIGRSSVTEGALVTANQTNALASVQQIDPIYVDVTQSSVELLRMRTAIESGLLQRDTSKDSARVSLVLADGQAYGVEGTLEFSEVTVDEGTGSVTLRAVFPNPDHKLLPGMFVRARILEGIAQQGLLVPQRGVTRNQRGQPTSLVVNAENKVELRTLKTDRTVGDHWLVTDGLKAGDKVIVEGLQGVQPGVEVTVKAFEAKPAQAAVTPSSASANAAK